MSTAALGPLEFNPILKRLRWGGRRLGDLLQKPIGPFSDYAESWEICDHGEDRSAVATGPWKGWTLNALICDRPGEMLGRHDGLDHFPLLVKFLDARDRLSVQVHPDDSHASAIAPGQRGKTEAWVVIEADRGSHVYAGLKPGIDRAALLNALAQGGFEECLHRHDVVKGDCFLIPAGTVHAIGGGIVLAEVQQSSDLTYRLFDWHRLGADGRPRPLHVERALSCVDFERGPVPKIIPRSAPAAGREIEDLVNCPFFTMRRHRVATQSTIEADDRCHVLIGLDGRWECQGNGEFRVLKRGGVVLIPASALPVQIIPQATAEILEVFWE